jgi:hypothetical protein
LAIAGEFWARESLDLEHLTRLTHIDFYYSMPKDMILPTTVTYLTFDGIPM